MTDREQYAPGPAGGAQIRKDEEKWTLILMGSPAPDNAKYDPTNLFRLN
jgi:hypothetical protein